MMNKLSFAALMFMSACIASLAHAADDALFKERFHCDPIKLNPDDQSSEHGFELDLDKAKQNVSDSSVRRVYDFPGTNIQVWFTMRYLPAEGSVPPRVEISKSFYRKNANNLSMILSFMAPQVLDMPIPAHTIFVFKTTASGDIPAFDTECQIKRERINPNCPNCR